MTYKFMNGWLVKGKDIDKIKKIHSGQQEGGIGRFVCI